MRACTICTCVVLLCVCVHACVYNLYMCNTAVCVLVLDCFVPSCRHSFTKSGKGEVLDEDR